MITQDIVKEVNNEYEFTIHNELMILQKSTKRGLQMKWIIRITIESMILITVILMIYGEIVKM
jgi:hypothetical protein